MVKIGSGWWCRRLSVLRVDTTSTGTSDSTTRYRIFAFAAAGDVLRAQEPRPRFFDPLREAGVVLEPRPSRTAACVLSLKESQEAKRQLTGEGGIIIIAVEPRVGRVREVIGVLVRSVDGRSNNRHCEREKTVGRVRGAGGRDRDQPRCVRGVICWQHTWKDCKCRECTTQ